MENTMVSLLESSMNETIARELLDLALEYVQQNRLSEIDRLAWLSFLDHTSTPEFLMALPDKDMRIMWADVVFAIIQHTEYSLLDMFEQRLSSQPYHILFQDMSSSVPARWSYEQAYRHIRETAAVLHQAVEGETRVAIFSANSYASAICDLACLMFDIFDTPLNVHFTKDNVRSIFERLNINVAIADSRERIDMLHQVISEAGLNVKLFAFDEEAIRHLPNGYILRGETAKLSTDDVRRIIEARPRRSIRRVATTMFTSGSTGVPKGVSFSLYNLVSKRFARHAAVPTVGKHEVMLCYLPLFHTFGRYLELLGTIYWRGTYVFAGNPSADTLLSLFPKINPSVFISIPLRWQQLYDRAMQLIAEQPDRPAEEIVRSVTGKRLHWGLSAAGYLAPATFLFFQKNGIELCSGFGMTEATGGITMTPPGDYSSNSVGKALPGMMLKLSELGELLIGGHYVTRYLEEAGPDDEIPYPHEAEYWLPTGDIFQVDAEGHYEIVDRVKDIYKNNKGQTVAPRTTEKLFADVPGIKRAFLVGDARPYNVLLIVADDTDEIIANESVENRNEYFHRIIMEANRKLAPYERVVNFKVLSRDFTEASGELTAKGTFNRKLIAENMKSEIEELYISNHVDLDFPAVPVRIPRWFYRDLGILEDDIVVREDGIFNRRTEQFLALAKGRNPHVYQIGDLKYTLYRDRLDLGIFARQPRLWLGNPALIEFAPVKEGWDIPLKDVDPQVILPKDPEAAYCKSTRSSLKAIQDPHLLFVNEMVCCALHSRGSSSMQCTRQIGDSFNEYDDKLAEVIRRRLEALSRHPEEDIRALAYRVLLLQDPKPDYSKLFPTFIQSGLSFLTEDSIRQIATYDMGKLHLESLRQRLYSYRTQLSWPATDVTRQQFENILKLLYNFASQHLVDYFSTIRAEFANWILHKKYPYLSKVAQSYFIRLSRLFDEYLNTTSPASPVEEWDKRLVFDEKIPQEEVEKLKHVFVNTRFLKKSVLLAYNEKNISLMDVGERSIWVVKLKAVKDFNHYRISINTSAGKHFDLHFMVGEKLKTSEGTETVYWHAAIGSHPYATNSLPALGCYSTEFGALATKFVSDLTVSEKVRSYAGLHNSIGYLRKSSQIRKLYIKAFSEFFQVWHHSGYRIVPGNVTPSNVVVPELDYLDSATLISIAAYKPYEGPKSIIEPLVSNFYTKVLAFYPWMRGQLSLKWVFEAAREVLNVTVVEDFFNHLEQELLQQDIVYQSQSLLNEWTKYKEKELPSYYVPLALYNAVDKYREWAELNPLATYKAKEETIFELADLYKLLNLPEAGRFHLYRLTYFTETAPDVRDAFDSLLAKMNLSPELPATRYIELSYLQETLHTKEDLMVFSKMVFPRLQNRDRINVVKIGAKQKEEVIVQTYFTDKNGNNYTFRRPIEPREVGQLYHLFFEENYPKSVSEMDLHFIVLDEQERVVAGLCYIMLDDNVVLLDGAAVSNQLKGRGIGSEMIESFATRMSSQGVKVIKAHFLRGNFYLRLNFKVDKKWGALVRFL